MSRNTSAAVTSASQLPQLRYRPLVEVYSLSTGNLYACAGDRFIYSGTNTYTPVSALGGIDVIREEADVFPRAVTLWFSIVGSTPIADALNENLFGKKVKIYRNFITDSFTCVGTPQLAFTGYMNEVDLKLGDPQRGNYFEVTVDPRLRQPTRARYFNKETLWNAMGYSGDTFFNYVPLIPTFKSPWGNAAQGIDYMSDPLAGLDFRPFDPNDYGQFFRG